MKSRHWEQRTQQRPAPARNQQVLQQEQQKKQEQRRQHRMAIFAVKEREEQAVTGEPDDAEQAEVAQVIALQQRMTVQRTCLRICAHAVPTVPTRLRSR